MPEPPCFVFGSFQLDLGGERLWCGHDVVRLPPKPFAVLACLVTQAGRLVTKDALLAAVWPDTVVSEDVITVAMRQLRRVLGDQARTPHFIETVHGRGYRFIAPVRALASSAGAAMLETPRPAPPPLFCRPPHFVGREAALAQLAQWWTTARQGTRQVGMIVGEPGIGKTALVETFLAQVAATEDVWVGYGQCLDHYGAGEAYLPLLEALGRFCRGPEGERLVALLRQQAPSWLIQMPGLVPSTEWERLQRMAGGATQPRMLRELTEALDVLTTERPLVLVVEDLHWSDRSTLEWLTYVARRRDPARLLLLGTYRPVDAIVRAHPIRTVMTELTQHQQAAELPLDYLSAEDVTAYCAQRWQGDARWEAVAHVLHQRTRGHPLFLVTLLDEMRRLGLLHEAAAGGEVATAVEALRHAVPASLRHIIEQQLHQVCPEDQGLLEAASLAGRAFSAAAVAAAVTQATEAVEARLSVLAHRGQFIAPCGLVEWPDGTVAAGYSFRHDLYREILYDRVPPSRQQRWHLQIGLRKERGYGAQARQMAAELAVHFARGHDAWRAVTYLQYAGENALQRSAYQEAIPQLTTGLEVLATVPETPARQQHELALLLALTRALQVTKGHAVPELEPVLTRACALGQQVGETPQYGAVLLNLWSFRYLRAECQEAQTLAVHVLDWAQRQQDAFLLLRASYALGQSLHQRGSFALACTHFAQGITCDAPQTPPPTREMRTYRMKCRAFGARTLWYVGYPDQAVQQSQEARTMADALAHPYYVSDTLLESAHLYACRREWQSVHAHAEAALALATAYGFARVAAQGTLFRGRALAAQGQHREGLTQMQQGLAAHRATGTVIGLPFWLAQLAEAYGQAGQVEAGVPLLVDALAVVDKTGVRASAAELHRLRGALLLQQPVPETQAAAACFQQALTVARRQQAKAWELRAATSLARLWQQQGKRAAAYALLAPIYGWFTEGLDTADLQEAKALLEELGG